MVRDSLRPVSVVRKTHPANSDALDLLGQVEDRIHTYPSERCLVFFHLECDISDLAYWSESEAREFQMQFLESYKPAMRTVFDHPIVGLVACHICGEPFIGCGDGRMRCVNYLSPGVCPAPVYIQESGAWAALNLYFP